jgi:enediyne biosynthesis protein E4
MLRFLSSFSALLLLFSLTQCQKNTASSDASNSSTPLFTKMSSAQTGIAFRNDLHYDRNFNIYKYRNFYNGGGVAIGDLNGDKLPDVYMSSNQNHNKLYLNRGAMKFEDITQTAKCAGTKAWATGVTMADINGDGKLDIYVCNSGDIKGDDKENELFINEGNNAQGIPTFREAAHEYGLADKGYSTHAAFFDYDHDGDLDCYLLNNSYKAIGSFNLQNNIRNVRDSLGGDKLYRNDNGKFVDVSAAANIFGSVQGFGLGVTIGDVNRDGWDDVYVCNDFFEMDYLYINQKNGTFKEVIQEQINHMSAASMGADMADLNNDAYPDIFNTDMLPRTNKRLKEKTTFDNWNKRMYDLQNGYYQQFTHNSLQINNRDNSFSEIAFAADAGATDWSWGALIFDFDNDGNKDLYVANAILKDLTDQDFIQFIGDESTKREMVSDSGANYQKLIDVIPSEALPNCAFRNKGNLQFEEQAKALGLGDPSFSNGSAYADLDNDGDLDLVVNNINMEAFVYRNETNTQFKYNHHLTINLVGEKQNTYALGTQVTLMAQGKTFYQEQMPMRGFESTMDCRLTFGVGTAKVIDTLYADFPNGKRLTLFHLPTDSVLTLRQADAKTPTPPIATVQSKLFQEVKNVFNFKHEENFFSDFDEERLIFQMHSTEGPKMCKGDVNGDGTEDVFIGGARGQSGAVFLSKNGVFSKTNQPDLVKDSLAEDVCCLFFDADGDRDLDLFVGSGGSDGVTFNDRIYLNDGKGNFKRNPQSLGAKPNRLAIGCVAAADINGDGFMDLFCGMRLVAGSFGKPVGGYIFINDGKGGFDNKTAEYAPELKELGMMTTAQFADVNGDKRLDLVIAGEYMPITVLLNDGKKLTNSQKINGLDKTNGWWNVLQTADVDDDGDLDLIVGNHGLNSRFKSPVVMYYGDFDKNGTSEQIICMQDNGNMYPCALRHDLSSQMPIMKKRYLEYKKYSGDPVENVIGKAQLASAVRYDATTLQSAIAINDGKGHFTLQNLPFEAQWSPIYAIAFSDFDHDGKADILLGGNFFEAKPEIGRYDANYGLLLKGDGKGQFSVVPFAQSALHLRGAVRDFALVGDKSRQLIVAQNNDAVRVFRY